MRKTHIILSIIFLLVFITHWTGCTKFVSTDIQFKMSPELLHIDDLMQHAPDSALQMLQSFKAKQEILSNFNTHYHSLLISEALYKSYSYQSYTDELRLAIHYFDSLAAHNKENDDLIMLSARSHYMNGAIFYESDSVITACKEYLHTLEIMENHFEIYELIDDKAKFMGLTYTRLGELFFNNGIGPAAIDLYTNALKFFSKLEYYSLANTYRRIGSSYHINNMNDSAFYYYKNAMYLAKKQNQSLIYGHSLSEIAPIYYELGYKDSAFLIIRQSFLMPMNEEQRLIRYHTLGQLYANERVYDSAVLYLEKSMNSKAYATRTVSAELLMKCYQALGDSARMQYYKNIYGDNFTHFRDISVIKTELFKIYSSYKQWQSNKHNTVIAQRHIIRNLLFLPVILVSGIIILIIIKNNINKDKILLEMKQKIEANHIIEEPVCEFILDIVNSNHFKSKVPCTIYKKYALTKRQLLELKDAIDRHYDNFTQWICKEYPELNVDDIDYCCLYYLGLKEADISVFMQRAYPTVCERSRKLKRIFNSDKPLNIIIQNIITMHCTKAPYN